MSTQQPRGLIAILALLLLSVSSVYATQRPNILWIVAEDMSPTLGCYGDAFAITPHIDQLGDEGVLYSNAFATAPVCSPSRSCLINGIYAPSQGTHHMRSAFPIPMKMSGFPSLLRKAGYFTSNNVKTDYNSGNYKEITRASWDQSSDTAHWRDRKEGQPFFCIFNLMTSHQSRTMVWPHKKFVSEVQSKLTKSEVHDPAKAVLPPYYPDTPVVRKTVARFYDCVTAMDKQVGAILKQLEDDGLADDTIVFFYSDHGSGMPRHKRALLDSGMHVPLIVRFPNNFQDLAPGKPGTKTARLVSFNDFGPTVLSLAGLDVPDYMDGRSYLGTRQDKPRAFVHGHRDRVDEVHDLARCVRDNRYLYIRNFMPHLGYNQRTFWPDLGEIRHEIYRLADPVKMTAPQWHFAGPSRPLEELYNRQSDPLNLHNLAGSKEHRDVQEKMRGELFRHIRDSRDLGFVPEAMAWEISKEKTLWELARSDGAYNQQRLVKAASQVGQAEEQNFLTNLKHPDAGVRFWGAVGLTASQSLTPRAVKALTAALSDTAIDVRIESADALARHGHTKESIAVLAAALSDENLAAVQHAARTIELLGDRAKSAVPAMKACDLRMKKIRPPGTSPIVVEPDKDKAMWVLFSTEVFLKRFDETDPSFQTIFNGKDLTGWDGDPKTWHVKDGAICCSGKAGNTWLIWRGGELKDFELRLQFRHLSGNSGVQVRSIEDKKWSVVGYQAEVAAQEQMGLWHHSKAPEPYRFSLSNAGEKGHVSKDGVKTLTRFAPAEKVRKAFRPGEWNEMVIVGQGPKLIQTVNGVVLSELVDLDGKHANIKGLLALQDHGGATEVHYKNIRLKVLSAKIGIKEAAAKERARERAIKAAVMRRNRGIRARDELPPYLKSASNNSQPDRSLQRPFDENFVTGSGDVIAFIGATQTVLQQRYGYLETLLTRADAEKDIGFRNLAWQADTVYRRQRPRNFGGNLVQLRRVDASIIIAAFGQIEAIDGVQEIPAFVAAYRKLLKECATQTRRIVLVTPAPFGKIDNPLIPDLTLHNGAVAAYAAAIRKLAAEMNYLCVDLSQRHADHDKVDGMHLTALGQFEIAKTTYQALQGASTKPISVDADGRFDDSGLEELRQAVLAKNELWFRYWRPANWGFLYGNRQSLAFSRDNEDLNKRLLPAEITGILPMIKDAEAAIAEKRK